MASNERPLSSTCPTATIQIGKTTRQIQARPATDQEYAQIWPKAEAYNPHWRNYAKTITRPRGTLS